MAQLLAEAHHENYTVETDWAFLTYRASDNVGVRFGKRKLTTFVVSDYIQVGYACPWARPPREVYLSNPLLSYQGVDTLLRFNFGDYNLHRGRGPGVLGDATMTSFKRVLLAVTSVRPRRRISRRAARRAPSFTVRW